MKFRDYLNESKLKQKLSELDLTDTKKIFLIDDKNANTKNGDAYPDDVSYLNPLQQFEKYPSLMKKINELEVTGFSKTDIGNVYVALRGLDKILK